MPTRRIPTISVTNGKSSQSSSTAFQHRKQLQDKTGPKAVPIQVGLRGAPSSSSSSSVVSFSSVVAAATAAESNAIPETEDSSKTLAEVSSQKYGSKRTSRSSTSGVQSGSVRSASMILSSLSSSQPASSSATTAASSSSSSSSALQISKPTSVNQAGTLGGPQVVLNKEGNIVINESSLTVVPESSLEEFEVVEEGVHPTAKYSSFIDRPRCHPWGIEETRHFYEALRQCGTDFTLLQAFFPSRTRKQLKKKFFREEVQHPELIKASLNFGTPLDIKPFEMHLGKLDELQDLIENNDTYSSTSSRKRGRTRARKPSSSSAKPISNKKTKAIDVDLDDDDLVDV